MLGDGEAPAEEVERVYAWFCRERGDVSHFHRAAMGTGELAVRVFRSGFLHARRCMLVSNSLCAL